MTSPVFPLLVCSLLVVTPCLAGMKMEVKQKGEISEGKPLSLNCLVVVGSYSSEDPFVWRKNYEILTGKTDLELQFAALERSDIGTYDCGYDVSGTMYYSRPFLLSFSYRPVVHISVKVKDFDSYVQAGFDVYLTCNVTDSHPEVPEDAYTWWYAKTCQDTASARLGEKTSVLKLPSVKSTDEGCYSCMAVNQPPLHSNASKMLHVSYLEYPCISVDPAVMEGDSTRVNCTVRSSPKATLELYKDGDLVRRVEGEGLLSHPISNVSLRHQGTYECRASNDDINATKSVTTDFQIRHKPVASDNGSLLVPVDASLGATVNLSVEFEANPPASVEWRQVSPDRMYLDAAVHSHNSSQLTVHVEAAEAVFCVKVSNQYGEFSRQFEVRGNADKGLNPSAGSAETTTKAPGNADKGLNPSAGPAETTSKAPEECATASSASLFGWGTGLGLLIGLIVGLIFGVYCGPSLKCWIQRCLRCKDPTPAEQGNNFPLKPEAKALMLDGHAAPGTSDVETDEGN